MNPNNSRIYCFILSLLLSFAANAQADTLCGKIKLKNGKAKFQTQVATTTCPKGFQVLLDLAKISSAGPTGATGPQGPKGDPGPGLANGSVGPLQFDSLPGARVTRNTDQVIPSSALTTIFFNLEEYDSMGFFVPTGDTITIPLAGTYYVSGSFAFGPNPNGIRSVYIYKNGVSIAGQALQAPTAVAQIAVSTVNRFAAGDTINLKVIQNSGSSLNAFPLDTGDIYLAVQWIAP